jgi:transcription antitermination factor NusG
MRWQVIQKIRSTRRFGKGSQWNSVGGKFEAEAFMFTRKRQWPWFAAQVRPGLEKSVNLHLENAGYKCFLPVAKCSRRWPDRIEEIELPLFCGYVFCRMNPRERLPVLQTPGVILLVGAGTTPMPVEEAELAAIQRVAKSGLPLMPWPYLPVGRVARMEHGPLEGLRGIVVRIKSGAKLVLTISLVRRSVAVDIDRSWIWVPASRRAAEAGGQNDRPLAPLIDPIHQRAG